MSGVIGRIKSAAPLSYTSGFEIFSASNNGGFGLDWITDELMTVKRARRLYISLIISVWQRSGAEREWGARGGGITYGTAFIDTLKAGCSREEFKRTIFRKKAPENPLRLSSLSPRNFLPLI